MPRHRRPEPVLHDNVLVQQLLKDLVGEAHDTNVGCEAFEANLLRVLTQAGKEAVAETKARSPRPAKKPRKR